MKFKNFTIYFFAVIGFVVIACSAAATTESIDDNPDIPPIVQSNIGKYQISLANTTGTLYITSVNTETGVSKTYYKRGNETATWTEFPTAAITFTH